MIMGRFKRRFLLPHSAVTFNKATIGVWPLVTPFVPENEKFALMIPYHSTSLNNNERLIMLYESVAAVMHSALVSDLINE